MTDLKIVKEKEVPPAKIYIPIRGRERDFYAIVGDKARQMFPAERVNSVVLFALNKMFRRAVFVDEMSRAGVEGNLPGRMASIEEKMAARKILLRSGFKIPDSSRAYVLDASELDGVDKDYVDLLEAILIEGHDLAYLIKETKQTKLTF
ncbi:MAG: hypothetical protein LLG16_07125 [Euryarchaeota archaeon]|nr:hypothetical protein [Euryarchaeota archaeon]